MASPRCDTCRFWNEYVDDIYGECRRHPPVINARFAELYSLQELCLDGDETVDDTPHWIVQRGVFPYTLDEDWCGEHKPEENTDNE
jgi:hypothetical protein